MAALKECAVAPLATVQEAGAHFGTNATADDVLDAGLAAVAVWEDLTAAKEQLDLIRNVRVQLGDLWGHGEQNVTWWITGAEDGAHLDHARLVYSRPGHALHNLAAAGFELRLNTAGEAAQVAAGAQVQDTKRQQAEVEVKAAELRKANEIRLAN